MLVEMLQYSDEEIVRRAIARCHGKGMASVDVIQKVIQLGHESVLEHWYATFDIRGISRVCLAQLTRHRIASYSVRSQRYCDDSQRECVVPASIPHHMIWEFNSAVDLANQVYRELINAGVSLEDARFVLPQGVATDLILTMNARELRHFFRLRLSPEAQWEIRQLAGKMLVLVREKAPNIFGDIKTDGVARTEGGTA